MNDAKRIYCHTEKTVEAIDRHLRFFDAVPPNCKPKNIQLKNSTTYAYDYVNGWQPRMQEEVNRVYRTAHSLLWKPTGNTISPNAREHYTNYVYSKALERNLVNHELRSALALIGNARLQQVVNPHGDFTLENVLVNEQETIFIDPGFCRGMECRENDEAKMLQSTYAKWDIINGTSGAIDLCAPFDRTPIHAAFLLCHMVRLLAHTDRHPLEVLRKARMVYFYLCQETDL